MSVVLNILSTIYFEMMEKVFMVMVEVDIGLIPDPLLPIIQVSLVDRWVFLSVAMIEVYMCLIPVNSIHITMGYYTLSAQGCLKTLFQGVCKEKSTSKSSLLLLSKHATTIDGNYPFSVTTK